jgi:RNA polymerase sigma-70 factor (ECF subfamily)
MAKQSTDMLAGSTKALGCADQAFRNTPLSDSQLIVRIAQRDEQALGMLYDHYGTLVYTIALRLTQDPTLAETLVQDIFRAVWQSAGSFQIGASVPVWLSRMTLRKALAVAHPQS